MSKKKKSYFTENTGTSERMCEIKDKKEMIEVSEWILCQRAAWLISKK